MAEAKERTEWNRFASLIVKVHNINQTSRSGLINFEQVHPFYSASTLRKHSEPTEADLAMARSLIGGRHGKSK